MKSNFSRTRALAPVARLAFFLSLAVVLGGVCSSGCSGDPQVVAKGPDWGWTRAELAEAYDRTHGEGRWQRANLDDRQRFLRTVVDREILVAEARRAIPALPPADERKVRTRIELRRIEDYHDRLRAAWRPDSVRFTAAVARFAREVRAESIQMMTLATGDSCAAFLARGGSFAEAYERFEAKPRRRSGPDLGWRPPSAFPLRVMRAVFLDDLPAGGTTAPVTTARGVWLLHAFEYRPLDPRATPGLTARTREIVHTMLYRDWFFARRDSLRDAHGVETHPENYPVLAGVVRAHLDSLRRESPDQRRPDRWKARGPHWLLAPEERSLPLFTIDGDVVTAEEGARLLDGLDLRFWPVSEQEFPLTQELRAIIDRLVVARHAEELGLTQSDEWKRDAEAIRDEVLLDRYHDEFLLPGVRATPAEAESLYNLDPARWKLPERVELAAVSFPPDGGEVATDFAARVRAAGSPQAWAREAEQIAEAVDGAVFVRSTDLLDVGRRTDPPEWAEWLRGVSGVPVGEIAGPFAFGQLGEQVVVRVILRLPEQLLEREIGLIQAQREVRIQGVDARMAEVVREAERRDRIRLYPDRLQ